MSHALIVERTPDYMIHGTAATAKAVLEIGGVKAELVAVVLGQSDRETRSAIVLFQDMSQPGGGDAIVLLHLRLTKRDVRRLTLQ